MNQRFSKVAAGRRDGQPKFTRLLFLRPFRKISSGHILFMLNMEDVLIQFRGRAIFCSYLRELVKVTRSMSHRIYYVVSDIFHEFHKLIRHKEVLQKSHRWGNRTLIVYLPDNLNTYSNNLSCLNALPPRVSKPSPWSAYTSMLVLFVCWPGGTISQRRNYEQERKGGLDKG